MAKKLKIDYSEDRLLSVASRKLDEHNPIGALTMLNRNVRLGDCTNETYMHYADAFDDMGLYEKCVNNWFKYLDSDFGVDYAEAFEGLAMAYMNLGMNEVSAFYYDKLLKETGGVDEAERAQLIQSFLGGEKNPLHVVYPPKRADYSGEIAEGVDKMRENDYEGAAEKFLEVPEENAEYINARNYLAMCYVISERYDEAEKVCLDILDRDDKNVQAVISYAAVKSEQGLKDESVEIARRALKIKTDNPEDIYKIATVCCENDLHAEAYETFCRLGYDMQYDFNMLYFKAIAAFNCGKGDKAVKIMQDLLTINPNSITVRRNLSIMKERIKTGDSTPMSYYYRLPLDEREYNVKTLIEFDRLNKTQLQAYDRWDELHDIILWCVDEADSRTDKDMMRAAASSAIKAGFDDIVRDILLNAFIADDVKIGSLQKLCERNEDNNFGVVCCNVYRCVDFYKVNIGRTKHKIFISAYSDLLCRFALIDSSYSQTLSEGCEQLYKKLESEGRLDVCTDQTALTAAIFASSNEQLIDAFKGDICGFFGADEKKYHAIMGD